MLLAQRAIRDRLKDELDVLAADTDNEDVKAAIKEWNDTFAVGATNGAATDKLVAALEACGCDAAKNILKEKDFLAKKSQWVFGGDGWAYDIGFGGLDHVSLPARISTSWYSTPRYTPTPADSLPSLLRRERSHSLLPAEKRPRRKIWLASPMTYGYVYVAQIPWA